MRKLVLALIGAGLLALMSAVPVFADHISPHQHFIVTPDGELVSVGPDACTQGPSKAFDNFHLNVHRGTPTENGFIQPNNPVGFVAAPCP